MHGHHLYEPAILQDHLCFLARYPQVDGCGGQGRVPQDVLYDRDGYALLEELCGPGVPQNVGVGEFTGNAGLFSPFVKHPSEIALVHPEDPALLVRKIHEIVRHAARDVWRNGDAPDGLLRRLLFQDPEPVSMPTKFVPFLPE